MGQGERKPQRLHSRLPEQWNDGQRYVRRRGCLPDSAALVALVGLLSDLGRRWPDAAEVQPFIGGYVSSTLDRSTIGDSDDTG